MNSIERRACQWIAGGDTGVSSKTIWSVMMSVTKYRPGYPYDSYDFGRCIRLLELIPEWRPRLHEVAEKHPEWKPIVDNWEKLEDDYVARDWFLIKNGKAAKR